MRHVIGIGVASDAIRAVVLRNGRVVWAAERHRASDASLATDIGDILGAVQGIRVCGATVRVAVGSSMARLKRISDLPPITASDVLARIIGQTQSKYFVERGSSLEVGGVTVIEPGSVWAAAMDANVLESMNAVAREHRIRVAAILPAPAVLHLAFADSEIFWADGQTRFEIVLAGSEIAGVRRRASAPGEVLPPLTPVDALAGIGEHASRFADAFGAAMLEVSSPWIELSSAFDDRRSISVLQRVRLPVAITVAAFVLAGLSPLAATYAKWRTDAERRAIRSTELWHAAESTIEQLTRANEVLARVDELRRSRLHVVPVLAEITRLLPDDAVLTRFEIEAGLGSVTLRTNDAGRVLGALRSGALIGNVQPHTSGNRPSEHGWEVTYRFEVLTTETVAYGGTADGDD